MEGRLAFETCGRYGWDLSCPLKNNKIIGIIGIIGIVGSEAIQVVQSPNPMGQLL